MHEFLANTTSVTPSNPARSTRLIPNRSPEGLRAVRFQRLQPGPCSVSDFGGIALLYPTFDTSALQLLRHTLKGLGGFAGLMAVTYFAGGDVISEPMAVGIKLVSDGLCLLRRIEEWAFHIWFDNTKLFHNFVLSRLRLFARCGTQSSLLRRFFSGFGGGGVQYDKFSCYHTRTLEKEILPLLRKDAQRNSLGSLLEAHDPCYFLVPLLTSSQQSCRSWRRLLRRAHLPWAGSLPSIQFA
jgi:hypothetical protein